MDTMRLLTLRIVSLGKPQVDTEALSTLQNLYTLEGEGVYKLLHPSQYTALLSVNP